MVVADHSTSFQRDRTEPGPAGSAIGASLSPSADPITTGASFRSPQGGRGGHGGKPLASAPRDDLSRKLRPSNRPRLITNRMLHICGSRRPKCFVFQRLRTVMASLLSGTP